MPDIVNIVYTGKGDGGVLDRQAEALSAATGYPYNRYPIKGVTANHFICYVEYGEKYSDWHQTPVSAWFTHREIGIPFKEFWWKLSASNVDLRISAARQYVDELHEYGLSAQARAALDPQFKPMKLMKKTGVPQVGLAGYVHPGGRKGEKLVAILAGSPFGQKVALKASGKGWPVACEEYAWQDLPGFYNSLDVFLCTSTIEGVPMPPLEALACGIPVVIPRGVGMLDELADVSGVFRYEAGDFVTMLEALELAVETRVDREELRALVAGYSAEGRAQDHMAAWAQLKAQIAAGPESDRHGKCGTFYVAYGEPARECARASIATFREHNPGVEVAVVSDRPVGGEDIFIEHSDDDIGARSIKVQIYDLAPRDWEYILYLDADTQITASLNFLYQCVLDGWDMIICKNPMKYHLAREMRRSDNSDEMEPTFELLGTDQLIQLNGGVFCFQRNPRTADFFHAWHEEWRRWGKRDQGALLRALHTHALKLFVLGNEWNTIVKMTQNGIEYEPGKANTAGILHYPVSARRWRGKVTERSDSPAAWAKVKEWERENRK